MDTTSLADAKARLSELIKRAEAGEPQIITRRGKPVAKIVAIEPAKKKRIDIAELRALTSAMPFQDESAGDFMRRLRDDARY
jgi:prevent-host-death family protein